MTAVTQGRLAVGVVGAGPAAIAMAQALAGAGHLLVGIAPTAHEDRDRAEAMLQGVDILTVGEVLERGELVIIAVDERELVPTIGAISEE